MKNLLTRSSKLLFAAPLLAVVLAVALSRAAWLRPHAVSFSLEVPVYGETEALEFSPDGKHVVAFFRDGKTHRYDGRIYDLESRSQIGELAMPVSFPRGKQMGVDTGERTTELTYGRPAWSSDGKWIASALRSDYSKFSALLIWEAGSGSLKAEYHYLTSEYVPTRDQVHFSPDGKKLIGEGSPPAVVDVATGKGFAKPDADVLKSSEAKRNDKLGFLAVKDQSGNRVRVIDAKTKKVVWEPKLWKSIGFGWAGDVLWLRDTGGKVANPAPAPNGFSRLRLWNGKTRQPLSSPADVTGGQYDASSFHLDEPSFVYTLQEPPKTDGVMSEVVMWDFATSRELWRAPAPDSLFFFGARWSPDGKWLLVDGSTLSDDLFTSTVTVYDKGGNQRLNLKPIDYPTRWSSDSKQLATVTIDVDEAGKLMARRLEIHRFED